MDSSLTAAALSGKGRSKVQSRKLLALLALALLTHEAAADIYMHNPRGSNNRLDRGNGNRENANRIYDSQNNDAGGYGMGGTAANPASAMKYIVGSELTVEWTAQHSCGDGRATCQFVIQYMCAPDTTLGQNLRDGSDANTISTANPTDQTKGMHEPFSNYEKCSKRERNMGLWTADQDMNGRTRATATRQDNNNNRYGFECPEERDYYPYWHPTPWKDIAVLATTNVSLCDTYKRESQNVKSRWDCTNPAFNNARACFQGGSTWVETPAWGIPPPRCVQAPILRDNHLGNTHGGTTTYYNWTIPDEVSSACTLRIRYNITTLSVGWDLDSRFNNGNSPVKTDPKVDIGFGLAGGADSQLQLAVNSDQHGRTFQDRTFRFEIIPRPPGVGADDKIYNLGVRGKRGNIVQTYPAVEYDYSPSVLSASPGSWVHFQWTGNDNTQNNGANNGEGRDGTDRSNIVQIADLGLSAPVFKTAATMFNVVAEMSSAGVSGRSFENLVKEFALLRQSGCAAAPDVVSDQAATNCEKLNAAAPTIDLGLLKLNNGTFHFMSTRNNNFSNRGQKGTIHVQPNLPPAPHIVSTSTVGRDGIAVTWSLPEVALASGAIDASKPVRLTAFLVEMSEDGGLTWATIGETPTRVSSNASNVTAQPSGFVEGNVTSLSVSELPAGITQAFRVSARNEDGWSAPSEPVEAMTAESSDSLRYKLLLKEAVTDRVHSDLSVSLGIGLSVAFIVLVGTAYQWHTHGSFLPWQRNDMRGRPHKLLNEEANLVPKSLPGTGAAHARSKFDA